MFLENFNISENNVISVELAQVQVKWRRVPYFFFFFWGNLQSIPTPTKMWTKTMNDQLSPKGPKVVSYS
jgi:hypothetical protein